VSQFDKFTQHIFLLTFETLKSGAEGERVWGRFHDSVDDLKIEKVEGAETFFVCVTVEFANVLPAY
jgi:hypothetical protein